MEMEFMKKMPYVIDVWQEKVKNNPEKLWIHDGIRAKGYSRKDAEDMSSRVYNYLKKKGIGKEDFCMICMPRCASVFITMLGVWKAGAAVTIADEHYSQERLDYIYEDCGCKLKIDMDVWNEMMQEDPLEGYEVTEPTNAAYAVYTSGSTGNPKGVLQEFGKIKLDNISVINDERKDFAEDTVFALVSPLNFVAGVKITTYSIYFGFELYIVPTDIVKNPIKLRNYLDEYKITSTFLSPSILRVAKNGFGPHIKTVTTGSESANGIFFDGVTLVNNYGMSEAAFSVAQFVIDKQYDMTPIGVPNYKEVEIQLLDDDGNRVKDGEKGEICFENPFFRGYINLPEETAEALRGGIFHTGDIGIKLEDGNYAIVGRKNEMLKINGNRVEPAEIEAQAKKLFGLEWCCVKGFIDSRETILCMYYTEDIDLTTTEIRDKLGEVLPYYMLPTHTMKIDDIPMLQNNKVNKKALPRPESGVHTEVYVAPETDIEKKLCEAFEIAFEDVRVGVNDDFFALGGDSVHAMEVLAAADITEFDVNDIYTGVTVKEIARLLEEKLKNADNTPLEEKELQARLSPQKLTPSQTMFFDMHLIDVKKPVMYMSFFFETDDVGAADKFRDAMNQVSVHRPIFSSIVEFNNSGYLQMRYLPEVRKDIEIIDISEEEMHQIIDSEPEVFELTKEPLYRMELYRTEKKLYIHLQSCHISSDGSMNQMIIKDIYTAYKGEPLEKDTTYLFLKRTNEFFMSDQYMEQKEYFERKYDGIEWCHSTPLNPEGTAYGFGLVVPVIEFDLEKMKAFEKKYNMTGINLMALSNMLAMAKVSKKRDILYIWMFSNRMDDISANAGVIAVEFLPVALRLDEIKTVDELFSAFKKEYDDSMRYHRNPWAMHHGVQDDYSIVVYEPTSVTGTENLDAMGLKLVKSNFFDPEGRTGALQYSMVYEESYGFRILDVYNSSRLRKEDMEQYAKLQKSIFNKLLNEDTENIEKLWSE